MSTAIKSSVERMPWEKKEKFTPVDHTKTLYKLEGNMVIPVEAGKNLNLITSFLKQ